jgi:hypothetical protein
MRLLDASSPAAPTSAEALATSLAAPGGQVTVSV